jgi:hypothetical protein
MQQGCHTISHVQDDHAAYKYSKHSALYLASVSVIYSR